MKEETRECLAEVYMDEKKELESLLQKDLEGWR
jgi:hypothetical protein